MSHAWLCVVGLSACLEPFPTYEQYLAPDASTLESDVYVQPEPCIGNVEYSFGTSCNLVGEASVCGVWDCKNGVPSCELASSAQSSLPDERPCNGIDDNCNGEIDEDAQRGQDCDTSLNGEPVIGRWTCVPAGLAMGMPYQCLCCEDGRPDCATSEACRTPPVECQPTPETCNQIDDDCDQIIDEGPFDSCLYDLGGCYLNGASQCVDGQLKCAPANELANQCVCIPPVIDGGSHYLSCATPHTWSEAEDFCGSLQTTYEQSVASLRSGRLLQIESGAEFSQLNMRLYDQGLSELKTWLNFRYDGARTALDFESWYAQNFPPQDFQAFDGEPSVDDDQTMCVSMDDDDDYEWTFEECTDEGVGVVCEFCDRENSDADNDGQLACGKDCDDTNENVYWGAEERCYNGVDDDCDGRIDEGAGGDGWPCTARMFEQTLYLFCAEQDDRASWITARSVCIARSMHLAVFETEAEFVGIAEIAKTLANNEEFWIGLRQPERGADNEGNAADRTRPWKWLRSEATYPRNGSFWLGDNANAHDTANRDCAYLRQFSNADPHIRAERCGQFHRFICESPIQIQ